MTDIIRLLQTVVYLAVGTVAVRHWLRRRQAAAGWLATSYAVLAAVSIVGFVLTSAGSGHSLALDVLRRVLLASLLLFPYSLFRFTVALRPAAFRPGFRAAFVATAVMAVASLYLPHLPLEGETKAWWWGPYLVGFVAHWMTLSGVAVVRMFRLGRTQPVLARRRLQLLASSILMVDVLLLLGVASVSESSSGLYLFTQALGMVASLLCLTGFVLPSSLRRVWQRGGVAAWDHAEPLLMMSRDRRELADALLPHASGLFGTETALLIGEDGTIRSSTGDRAFEQRDLLSICARLAAANGDDDVVTDGHMVAVKAGVDWLVVVADAATPLVGWEALAELRRFGRTVGLAMERIALYERDQANRRALVQREQQLAAAHELTGIGSFETDVATGQTQWSPEMHRLFGFATSDRPTSDAMAARIHPEDHAAVSEVYERILATGQPAVVEYRVVFPTAEVRHLRAIGRMSDDGNSMIGAVQDCTEQQTAVEALTHQARHDALTGLPNRALFVDHLEQALARLPDRDRGLAVLFADVDRFKWINDSLGHVAGDQLLIHIAGRMADALRPGDLIARFGGDEFVVLCEGVGGEDEAAGVAARLAEAIDAPIEVDGFSIDPSISIGIAVAAPGARAAQADLLRDADAAMYLAKERGRSRYEVFDATIGERAAGRLETQRQLRDAIESGQLVVHYQPEIDLATSEFVGLEALVRWPHPTKGTIAPSAFIPLAEETGLIIPLGAFVLEQALAQLAAWGAACPGRRRLTLSVNLSARQLLSPGLADHLGLLLSQVDVPPETLCLEITESVLLDDLDAAITALNELKSLGVRLGIDDFGTGYSSLTYLRRLPVDVLKIDRTFVEGVVESAQDRAIVGSVVTMAHALGLTTVAEGIESPRQAEALERIGVQHGQGYLWSPAQPALEISAMMNDHWLEPQAVYRRRILVVDDDASFRRVLRSLIDSTDGFTTVAEAADGNLAVGLAEQMQPDLILLDVAMPTMGGVEALPLLRAAAPKAKIVVLSALGNVDDALRQGVEACLTKSMDLEMLPARLGELITIP